MPSAGKGRRDWKVADGNLEPLGYARYDTLSSAVSLSDSPAAGIAKPAAARLALFVVKDQAVRWRDDGSAPTASAGIPIEVDIPFWYNGDLDALQFIEVTAGAELNVAYYN